MQSNPSKHQSQYQYTCNFHNVPTDFNSYSLKELKMKINLLFQEHPLVRLLLKPVMNQFEYALDQGLVDESQYAATLLIYLADINKILSK